MNLKTPLISHVDSNDIRFEIDLSFNNVLLLREMLSDDDLDNWNKVEIGLEMLVKNYKDIKKITFQEQVEVFTKAIELIQEPKEEKDEQPTDQPKAKKQYDFEQDAELIYASFLMDYNIDLMDVQGDLHWKKFIALLNGLSDDTPFMKVVEIRTKPLPKPNKHNAEERKELQKLKRKYAIEQDEQDVNESMNQAANFLRGKAKGGGK